jgi:hypothetical protein
MGCRLFPARRAPVLPALLLAAMLPGPAVADLLAPGEDRREISFSVADGKPMIAATVGGAEGRMMFDMGTPDAVFLNRDALDLPEGRFLAEGRAASGQIIEVREHEAAPVTLGGQAVALGPALRSGNFGFAEAALGDDFLGFVGAPAVAGEAFVLDYGRQVLTILRAGPEGALADAPAPGEVLARIEVAPGEAGLPTAAAEAGGLPLALDLDTGDGGTLYLRPATRAALEEAGLLAVDGDRARLAEATFGGAAFRDLGLRLVEAGGPGDGRSDPDADLLRIGAAFLARYPTLWNIPAGTVEVLGPGAAFLEQR